MSDGGSAQPVIPVTTGFVSAAPALRVAVVSDGRPTLGGPSLPVYVVTDNRPTQGNVPMPVVLATGAQASNVMAGPAIPVVVVSGSLNTNTPPVNTVLPVVSGSTTIGSLLSTTDGTWTGTPAPTFTYQWKRNGVAIGGATANTYTLVIADNGTTITVTVTATNVAGNASATSAGTAISNLPANTVLPVISGGTAAAVTTTDGTWTNSPSSFTYQWKRNGVNIGGATANTYTIVTADIGTTITVTVTATNAAGSTPATSAGYSPTYTQKVIALGPIGYWPQAESSGTVALDASGNGRNGAYTGVTLGQTGIGDGRTSASYDGATSYANIYTAGLAGAFSGAEGTIALWIRVANAGVWSDATIRRLFTFQADSNNRVQLARSVTNNNLIITYVAGGTATTVSNSGFAADTNWIHMAVTWSKAADQLKLYKNGAQLGTTQTGLGVFVGALNATAVFLGAASNTPTNVWNGFEAHAAVWNTPLSAAQIATLAVVP